MAARKRLGLREVRELRPDQEVWDAAVPGFGARRRKGAAVSYILMFRTAEGRLRRFTIGRHGAPWTPDTARDEARRLLGEVVRGVDPSAEKRDRRGADTVADLCDAYVADAEAGRLLTRRGEAKKPSTLVTDRSRIEAHIRPLLGAKKIPAVTRGDVEAFMHSVAQGETRGRAKTAKKHGLSNVRGGKGAAARTMGLLGALFSYAERKGLRADNPVRGVVRFADGRRERRLSDGEYAALGAGLRKAGAEGMWPAAVACARFLALTGWRSGEALGLRWGMVDLAARTARLTDTKTGASSRPLSRAACDVLRDLGRGAGETLVFPATRGGGLMTGFPSMFARIAKLGGLPADVTPHVLRHSFASLANDLSYTEATVGMLVGHTGHGTTRGYMHGADAVLLAAADKVADTILERMAEAGPGTAA
jgi:integrase